MKDKSPPIFAIVGHVNKGKSSIVSTLTEDHSVVIRKQPGTTRVCQRFPIVVDDQTLLELIDTPGFEQARSALAWMQQRESETGDPRSSIVQAFLLEHASDPAFKEERRLLTPLVEGAGILYVVDGSRPFRRPYRAEMEILRWTGQPRMALINRIGDQDHVEAWRVELDQYFSLVRTFDAHNVGFTERVRLLRSIRELREDWRPSIDQAIDALIVQWRHRRTASAREIGQLLVNLLTLVLDETVPKDAPLDTVKKELQTTFHNNMRKRERESREVIQRLYRQQSLERLEDELEKPIWDQDLFAKRSWSTLGMTPRQLVAAGALSGATIGGGIDASAGGASFLAGTALGAAIGGITAATYAAQRIASVKSLWRSVRGGRLLRIGPHRSPNLPWVVLDRALLHWDGVRSRSHARREALQINDEKGKIGFVTNLEDATTKQLTKVFAKLRRRPTSVSPEKLSKLEQIMVTIVEGLSEEEETVFGHP